MKDPVLGQRMLEVLVVLLTTQLDMLPCLEMLGVGGPRWVHR